LTQVPSVKQTGAMLDHSSDASQLVFSYLFRL